MVNNRFGSIPKSEHEMPVMYTEEPGIEKKKKQMKLNF